MSEFDAKPAVRERVPLWLGLFGPPASGKTFSALRLATGIAAETESAIYVVDTEARRSLHYADSFRFKHIGLSAPFSSARYLEAARACVEQGAGIIIVDSFSHEHEGPGGYLDSHDAELDAIAGDNREKRASSNMLAWAKPSRARQSMVNSLVQLPCHFILCFRAKERIKPIKDQKTGRMVPTQLGWQPISGTELLYSMTVSMRLPPHSGGVPAWESPHEAERLMTKLPEHFKALFADGRPIDEKLGAQFARWAAGSKPMKPISNGADDVDMYADDRVETLLAEAACGGSAELAKAWGLLPTLVRRKWKAKLDSDLKPIAEKFDDAAKQEAKAQAHAPT